MSNGLPKNSKIIIRKNKEQIKLTLPAKTKSPFVYFIGCFTGFWLMGWFFGLMAALSQFFVLLSQFSPASLFFLFWICGWSVGGLFAARTCFRCFQATENQSLILSPTIMTFDSGIPAFEIQGGWKTSTTSQWGNLFPKRKLCAFNLRDLKSLSLRNFRKSNRLTIDKNLERINIGCGLTEVEREWLQKFLKGKYRV